MIFDKITYILTLARTRPLLPLKGKRRAQWIKLCLSIYLPFFLPFTYLPIYLSGHLSTQSTRDPEIQESSLNSTGFACCDLKLSLFKGCCALWIPTCPPQPTCPVPPNLCIHLPSNLATCRQELTLKLLTAFLFEPLRAIGPVFKVHRLFSLKLGLTCRELQVKGFLSALGEGLGLKCNFKVDTDSAVHPDYSQTPIK